MGFGLDDWITTVADLLLDQRLWPEGLPEQKAYDLLVQAESGLCAVRHRALGCPGRFRSVISGMQSFQAIMQGLFARTRTGRGRIIDVSLITHWLTG